MHKALSVLKRRMGRHATDIRELSLSSKGLALGPRLSNLEGVLSGVPRLLSGGE